METKEITYYAKLVAMQNDAMDYTNYVFENLNYTNPDYQYIMCVKFPNWNQSTISINDVGYVTFKYVEAGIDKWYDGNDFNTYKYTNIVFLKFVPHKEIDIKTLVVD